MTASAGVKAAARRVLEEIFPADDEAAVIEAVTDDFINHEAPPGTPPGPAGVILYMHALARAFSDQQWTIQRVIAEGDIAVVYCRHSGRTPANSSACPPPAAASPTSRCT